MAPKWRASGPSSNKPSATASASATPGPPSQAELLSYYATPRPFKSPTFNKTLNRRNKTLKQILTNEREAALGLLITGKRKGKKPLASGLPGSPAGSPKVTVTKRGKVLVGAAAKAAQRKAEAQAAAIAAAAAAAPESTEAEENVEAVAKAEEAEEVAEVDSGDVSMVTANGDGRAEIEAEAEADPDTSMVSATNAETADGGLQQQQPKRDVPSYSTVEAPPSLRPHKKYCDVTGLVAPYTDPKTGLRYHNAEIYEIIKGFGPGVDQAYLSLRGESTQIK